MIKKSLLFLIAAMIVYTIMMTYTLPKIQDEANGYEVFDLRPMGYTVEEGEMILEQLSDEGLRTYQFIQLPLDFFYPILLALFCYYLWGALTLSMKIYKLRWIMFSVMLFDYLENLGIYWILSQRTAISIRATSVMSVMKAMSTTLVMSSILILIIYKLYKSIRERGEEYA